MTTIVYGGSLAALVACDQLTGAGHPVTLVTPTSRLGGHFAGERLGDARFDRGLVVFDFGEPNATGFPDPVTYDPDARNDGGRFGNLLASYTASLGISIGRAPGFVMWSDGRLIPDFVCDARLEGVRALPSWLRAHARAELEAMLATDQHAQHVQRQHLAPRDDSASYEVASIANHGAVLHHSCFEPFARKVTGSPSSELLARHARSAWLPLFGTETLAAAFAGGDELLPEIPFHVVRGGAVADLVPAIVRRLEGSPLLTHIVRRACGVHADSAGIRVELDDGAVRGTRLIWGHDLEDLATITGNAPVAPVVRTPVVIVLALVSRAEIAAPDVGTVIVPDDQAMPFRITNQSANAGVPDEALVRLSVEWGGADAPADDDALLALTQAALARVGITTGDAGFVAHRIIRIRRALVLPSADNRDTIHDMRQRIDACGLPIVPVAPAAGFGVASLNDQIVQGMKAARLVFAATGRTVSQADGADGAGAVAA